MIPEFLSPYGTLVVIMLFIVFVIVVRKAVSVLLNALLIAAISAFFPLFMIFFAGYPLPLSIPTFVFFISLGLGLYALYILARMLYSFFSAIEKICSPAKATEKRLQKLEKKSRKNE